MYVLTKCKIQIEGIKRTSYGFALKGSNAVRYNDLSTNRKSVKGFIKLLNRQKAEICHLPFLVEDFLSDVIKQKRQPTKKQAAFKK